MLSTSFPVGVDFVTLFFDNLIRFWRENVIIRNMMWSQRQIKTTSHCTFEPLTVSWSLENVLIIRPNENIGNG